jgi:hypothetical protein
MTSDKREAQPGQLRDEQTKAAAAQAERAQDKREGREGGDDKDIRQPGPDGCVHLMEYELIAHAKSKDADEPKEPDSRVIHIMELQMKGEAVKDYADNLPKVDHELPEEPLPGKPNEPPLGGSRSGAERR